MGWQVCLTRQADRDLAEIVGYIAKDDPPAAERFGLSLLTRVESLSLSPLMGVRIKGQSDLRALLHRGYYVIYRCDDVAQRIEVIRFWHTARDLGRVKLRDIE